MVGDAALREIVRPDPPGSIPRADHRFACSRAFARQPLALQLEQPRPKHLQRFSLVLVLRLLVLLDDHETGGKGGKVSDPNGAVGSFDRLSAWAGRSIDVDPQILVVDMNVDVLGFRKNSN